MQMAITQFCINRGFDELIKAKNQCNNNEIIIEMNYKTFNTFTTNKDFSNYIYYHNN